MSQPEKQTTAIQILSQPEKKTIAIHVLPNKVNHAIKFSQLIQYKMRNIFLVKS